MAVQTKGVAWEPSLDQAKENARKQGKPLLLDFSAAPT